MILIHCVTCTFTQSALPRRGRATTAEGLSEALLVKFKLVLKTSTRCLYYKTTWRITPDSFPIRKHWHGCLLIGLRPTPGFPHFSGVWQTLATAF